VTRETAYTALSRGRHANDAYLPDTDRRSDERHGAEHEPEPVDQFRTNAGRSLHDVMAIDQLRARRDELAGLLGPGPPDVRSAIEDLDRRRERTDEWLKAADSRRDRLESDLDRLGRFGHRHQRTDLRSALADADRDIGRHRSDLDDLESRRADLAPAHEARSQWEIEHRADLDEHRAIDRYLTLHDQHERDRARIARHELEVERGFGIEL
jgi:hypothetical protein